MPKLEVGRDPGKGYKQVAYSGDLRPGSSVFIMFFDLIHWLLFDMKMQLIPQRIYFIYQPHPSTCSLTTPPPSA